MATVPSHPPPPPPKTYDLEITIVSAKHLKNVNWVHGDLKPYVIFWVDPDQRRATQSDDSGNTRPVWNERFIFHLGTSPYDTVVTFEIFHSKPLETPKPLVGTLRVPLKEVIDLNNDFNKLRTFELRRPSSRPHGKIKLKLAIRESRMHDYQITLPSSYYYSPATQPSYRTYPSYPPPPPPPAASPSPPPPPPHSAHSYPYGGGYSDQYSSYYSQPPPPPSRPFVERQSSYYGGLGLESRANAPVNYPPPPPLRPSSYYVGFGSRPSAPVDYPPPPPPYDQKGSGKMGVGVGAVAGALGGLTLGEGLKYDEEGKISERGENSRALRDDYSNYSVEYLC